MPITHPPPPMLFFFKLTAISIFFLFHTKNEQFIRNDHNPRMILISKGASFPERSHFVSQ